jgi:hypothetical protein
MSREQSVFYWNYSHSDLPVVYEMRVERSYSGGFWSSLIAVLLTLLSLSLSSRSASY